jgi:hypothetical protein
LFAKRHLIDGGARCCRIRRIYRTGKAERARVFNGTLEHKGPEKLVARIDGRNDNTSAIHTAIIDLAALGQEISTMEGLIWV